MSVKIKFLLSCLPLIFVLSCGGGGSGNGGAADDGGSNSDGGDGDVLNSGLLGKFFFTYYGDNAYTMDVDTGEYRLIPNTDWKRQRDRFPDGVAVFSAKPVTNSNTDFVVLSSGGVDYGSEIALQDYNGNYLGQLHISAEVFVATMSQDRQYVAVFKEASNYTVADYRFAIYDWNSGALIDYKELTIRQLLWLQDNRLLYAEGRTFHITRPASTETDYTMSLPDPGGEMHAGEIGDIALSPDGSQMAFTIGVPASTEHGVQDANNHRLYMSNIDGTNLHLVATKADDPGDNSDYYGGPRVATPAWSPDGRWLYVREGYVDVNPIGEHVDTSGYLGDMYVLPTEDMGKVLYLSTDDSQRSPEVRRLWRFQTLPDEAVGGGITNERPMPGASPFIWISD
jgi:hypothetical protein